GSAAGVMGAAGFAGGRFDAALLAAAAGAGFAFASAAAIVAAAVAVAAGSARGRPGGADAIFIAEVVVVGRTVAGLLGAFELEFVIGDDPFLNHLAAGRVDGMGDIG